MRAGHTVPLTRTCAPRKPVRSARAMPRASMSYWMARLVAVIRTRSVAGASPCSCALSWTRWPRKRGSVSSPASISTASGSLPGRDRDHPRDGHRRDAAVAHPQLAFEDDPGAGRRPGRPRGAGHQDAARVVGHQRLIDGRIVVGDDAGDGQDAASAPLLQHGDGSLDAESRPAVAGPAPACRRRSSRALPCRGRPARWLHRPTGGARARLAGGRSWDADLSVIDSRRTD